MKYEVSSRVNINYIESTRREKKIPGFACSVFPFLRDKT